MAFYGPPSLMTFQLWEIATWTVMSEAEKSTEGPVIQDPEIIDTARQSACLSPREIHRAHQWMLGKEDPSLMNVKSKQRQCHSSQEWHTLFYSFNIYKFSQTKMFSIILYHQMATQ